MIDYNPSRDMWMNKFIERTETWTKIIDLLARKALQPTPVEQAGTYVCPYCYLDTPHSFEFHQSIKAALDQALAQGIVLTSEKERTLLRTMSKQLGEHSEPAKETPE